jgi:predicted TIM-barrel fold metal-dependent hydrolase
MISADSHVIESPTLYRERLPASLRDRAPQWPSGGKAFKGHPGGWDPKARLGEMAQDGVSAEVLFPSLALRLFAMKDAGLQQACFRVYNDWLAEYCSVAPDRLIGIALISAYDIDQAVAEVHRVRALGMRGIQLWQVPPEGLEFSTDHYERLWATIADLGMPLSLHILSGFDWSRRTHEDLSEDDSQDRDVRMGGFGLRGMTNYKLLSVTNALHDLLIGGALERHPGMKLTLVESEIGWIPFLLERWDKYFRRPSGPVTTIDTLPSELFARQVYATFIDDEYGTRQLSWWGAENCMWSSDFPHVASSWPDSRQVISGCLAGLPPARQERLAWQNCAELYGLDVGTILTTQPAAPRASTV